MGETTAPLTFAALLRSHRVAAGLTQEALAERAGLSTRGIQSLESGVRRPFSDTLERLIYALGLEGDERTQFLEAGKRPLPAAHGDAAARSMPRHNLPEALTSLIARERHIDEVRGLLEGHRLVTLTGAGGVGKTRLALAVAAELVDTYADGVWLVELAALADPAQVAHATAAVLGLREHPERRLLNILAEALRARRLLLVLDNCEHLLDACAELADAVLRWCPGVRVLATSREVLGLVGEVAWRVPSLAVPDPSRLPPTRELAAIGAVRLFVERAAAARAGFALTDRNGPAVAEVCRRLDGIPLALELAAARLRGLAVEHLAARLDEQFRLLTGGSRTALPRQQTLRAMIDWSHDLLEERERRLFRRLALFAGGWTAEAAEVVCSSQEGESDEILELLLRLVDKSLVIEEGGRYHLLETLRQYAKERLHDSDEHEAVQVRHAAYYLAFAEQVEREFASGNTGPLNTLEDDCDNVRAALGHYALVDDVEALLRLAGALQWFWIKLGHLSEGRRWLDDALGRRGEVAPGARERALHAGGLVAWAQGDFDRADTLLQQSVAGYRRLGDPRGVAWALATLANATRDQGKFEEAAASIDEALLLGRDQGDTILLGTLTIQQGIIAREEGDFDLAEIRLNEALGMARSYSSWPGSTTEVLQNLGALAEDRQEYGRAHSYLRESLTLTQQAGDKFNLPFALDSVASLAVLEGCPERALRLAAAAAAWRGRLGMIVPPMWRPRVDRTVARARGALDDATIAAAWAYGEALTMDEAIALALEEGGEG